MVKVNLDWFSVTKIHREESLERRLKKQFGANVSSLVAVVGAVLSQADTPLGMKGLFPQLLGVRLADSLQLSAFQVLPQLKTAFLLKAMPPLWGSPHLITD